MTKILNIDALAAEEREIQLKGRTYKVEEMSVQNFIETTKSAETILGRPLSEQVEESVKMIKRSIPEVPEEELRAVPLRNLQAIIAFIRGEDPASPPEGAQEEQPAAKKTSRAKTAK